MAWPVTGIIEKPFVNSFFIRNFVPMMLKKCCLLLCLLAVVLSVVAEGNGNFFRNFKAVTGMTPREWIGNIG
jgi:hypothetical protein